MVKVTMVSTCFVTGAETPYVLNTCWMSLDACRERERIVCVCVCVSPPSRIAILGCWFQLVDFVISFFVSNLKNSLIFFFFSEISGGPST